MDLQILWMPFLLLVCCFFQEPVINENGRIGSGWVTVAALTVTKNLIR
jgi:hypothetical protein